MGSVFRAEDVRSGAPIALKRMLAAGESGAARFVNEARTLASVRHPAIVGYVDHGVDEDGDPYLAMEWIEGEDLAHTLLRGALAPQATLALAKRVADGLAALHAAGLLHRDLKPANIVLEGGDPLGARIVDLGVARAIRPTRALTRTGAVLGTVGYMAPEQVEGKTQLDARVDVFALGCVLFECLTGIAAYQGEHPLAVLARVLLDEAPRVSHVRPETPSELDALIFAMMARNPERRPADGAAVSLALGALDERARTTTTTSTPSAIVMLQGELRPLALVLARAPRGGAEDETAEADDLESARAAADAIASRWEGQAWRFASNALVLLFEHGAGVREQASRAAHAALELSHVLPDWSIAVATPSMEAGGRGLLGAMLERAAARLSTRGDTEAVRAVRLDDVTAALLDAAFFVEESASGSVLRSFSPLRDDARPLLGKITPCVGREKELRLLEATLEECVLERSARGVLLLADAGWGKSKLRREFVAWARDRDDVRVLSARTDGRGQLQGFGLLRDLLLDAADLRRLEPEARWSALHGYARAHLDADGIEFLGELAGAPPSEPSATLLATRRDPTEMRFRLSCAFADWLRSEANERPLVLSLEDLHDADASSISFLCDVWKSLSDRPVLLVGTARPEVESLHPTFVALDAVQRVRLGKIGRRAAELLVRQSLGDELESARVAQLIERADGHPFLLEELVRHAASVPDDRESAPASVLALVQSRLMRLSPEARRFLRAASVFGERFPLEGVSALVGQESTSIVDTLASAELIVVPQRGHDSLLAFRHALVREAAYAMLPADELAHAHRTAGRWLAARERPDAVAVADQLAYARDADAASWFLRAAREAAERGGLLEALDLARRGQINETSPERRTELVFEEVGMQMVAGRFHDAFETLHHQVPWDALDKRSGLWLSARCEEAAMAIFTSRFEIVPECVERILSADFVPPASDSWGRAVGLLVAGLTNMGAPERDTARALFAKAEQTPNRDQSERLMAYLDAGRAELAMTSDDGSALDWMRSAVMRFERAKSRNRLGYRAILASYLATIGHFDEALVLAREVRIPLRQRGMHWYVRWSLIAELRVHVFGSERADCDALMRESEAFGDPLSNPAIRTLGRMTAALARPEDAATVDAVYEELSTIRERFITMQALVNACLAHLALMREQPDDALARSQAGLSMPAQIDTLTWLHLSRVRALRALSRDEEAHAAYEEAHGRSMRVASQLSDADRALFLRHPFHVELLALAP